MSGYVVPDVVLLEREKRGRGTDRRMHIPDPDDPTDSICRYSGDYRRKPAAAAIGYVELCPGCARAKKEASAADE